MKAKNGCTQNLQSTEMLQKVIPCIIMQTWLFPLGFGEPFVSINIPANFSSWLRGKAQKRKGTSLKLMLASFFFFFALHIMGGNIL